jgi:DNA-binding transcriptional regulator LsrR (DeoR family)
MVEEIRRQSRIDLLADVAELYYVNNQNQAEIAQKMGVTVLWFPECLPRPGN